MNKLFKSIHDDKAVDFSLKELFDFLLTNIKERIRRVLMTLMKIRKSQIK